MRTRLTTLAAALLVLGAVGTFGAAGTAGAAGFFVDDDNSVHEASIEAIADVGITVGCNPPVNDRFCPEDSVSRGQMATFLVRALGLPAAASLFVDTSDSVHEANIGALAAAGITQGCNPPTNDRFCPGEAVTRAQMATFLTRALNLDASPRVVVSTALDLAGVELNTPETETIAELTALFGPPTIDEAGRCPYFFPTENMRYVRWGSLIAAIKTLDSGDGQLGLVGWRYKLDGSGQAEAGGPQAEHVELPSGLELLDPIGDAATATGSSIQTTAFGWMIVDGDFFTVEATGLTIDPAAPIDGVQQGFGFSCE